EFRDAPAKPREPFDVVGRCEDRLRNPSRGVGFVERDVFDDLLQVTQRRLGPDRLSHLAKRCLASAWLTVRPSRSACSPNAMPSRMESLRCSPSNVFTSMR